MACRTDTGSRAMKGNLYRLERLCSYPTLTVETVSTRGPIQVQCGGRIEVTDRTDTGSRSRALKCKGTNAPMKGKGTHVPGGSPAAAAPAEHPFAS